MISRKKVDGYANIQWNKSFLAFNIIHIQVLIYQFFFPVHFFFLFGQKSFEYSCSFNQMFNQTIVYPVYKAFFFINSNQGWKSKGVYRF